MIQLHFRSGTGNSKKERWVTLSDDHGVEPAYTTDERNKVHPRYWVSRIAFNEFDTPLKVFVKSLPKEWLTEGVDFLTISHDDGTMVALWRQVHIVTSVMQDMLCIELEAPYHKVSFVKD